MDKNILKARIWAAARELEQVEAALRESQERVRYCKARKRDLKSTIRDFKDKLRKKP